MKAVMAVVALALLSGCHVVQEVGYPAEFVAEHGPTHVWVTMADNSQHELWNPTMNGDTLLGFTGGDYFEAPIKDVRIMRASFIAPGRTALVIGAGLIVTAVGVAYGTKGGQGPNNVCFAPGTDYIEPCPQNVPNGAGVVVGDWIH